MSLAPAGPQILSGADPTIPMSPSELLMIILEQNVDTTLVRATPPVIVGKASNAQQQQGVISITDAGPNKIDRYMPVMYSRQQIRCMAHNADVADRIGYHVFDILNTRHREVITDSTGSSWLVHRTAVLSGPSLHYDTSATEEMLMFIEMMIGREPVNDDTEM